MNACVCVFKFRKSSFSYPTNWGVSEFSWFNQRRAKEMIKFDHLLNPTLRPMLRKHKNRLELIYIFVIFKIWLLFYSHCLLEVFYLFVYIVHVFIDYTMYILVRTLKPIIVY